MEGIDYVKMFSSFEYLFSGVYSFTLVLAFECGNFFVTKNF